MSFPTSDDLDDKPVATRNPTGDSFFRKKLEEFEEDLKFFEKKRVEAAATVARDWEAAKEDWNRATSRIRKSGSASTATSSGRVIPTAGSSAILEPEVWNDGKRAQKKQLVNILDIVAAAGLVGVAVLLALSVVCASGSCGVQSRPLVSNGAVVMDTTTNQPLMEVTAQNIPLDILESQFMLALVGGVIAPVVVRILKQKYDIDIEETQVSMIMTDAIKSVKLYQNEANRLRDKETGRIPNEYAGKLKDLAFDSIRTNYTTEKYNSVVSRVGTQVFEKAIKEAVKRNWMENFPLEKKQVEQIISQSIDALPQIVDWQNQSEDMKMKFIDGHIRKLLFNMNVEGWGLQQLEEMFDAEVNKRSVAAAMAEAKGMLNNLTADNMALKYTSTILLAAGESLMTPRNPDEG